MPTKLTTKNSTLTCCAPPRRSNARNGSTESSTPRVKLRPKKSPAKAQWFMSCAAGGVRPQPAHQHEFVAPDGVPRLSRCRVAHQGQRAQHCGEVPVVLPHPLSTCGHTPDLNGVLDRVHLRLRNQCQWRKSATHTILQGTDELKRRRFGAVGLKVTNGYFQVRR